jgi:hypothetical protein
LITTFVQAAGSPGVEHSTQAFLETLAKGGGKPIEMLSPAEAREVLIDAQRGAALPVADVSQKPISVDGKHLLLRQAGDELKARLRGIDAKDDQSATNL